MVARPWHGPDEATPLTATTTARIVPPKTPRSVDPRTVAGVSLVAAIAVGCYVGFFGAAVPIAVIGITIGLFGVAWASIRTPGILLAAYLLIPFYKASFPHVGPVDVTALLAVINGFQVLFIIADGDCLRGSRGGLALWVAFGVVILAGVLWAGDQALALNRAATWWALIVVPVASAIRVGSERRHVDAFLGAMLVAGAAIVVLGLPNLFTGANRVSVLGENSINTGFIAVIVCVIAIAWLFRVAPAGIRWLSVPIIPLAVLLAVASGSRGPLLAFALLLLFAMVRRPFSKRRLSKLDVGIATLALTTAAILSLALVRLPTYAVSRLTMAAEAVGSRSNLFAAAAEMFSARPILGNGTGSFAVYAQSAVDLTGFSYPHNDLLQIGAELGLLGVGIFVALVVLAVARRLPDEPAWWAVRGLFVLAFFESLVSGDIYEDRLLWGLLVMLLSAPLVGRIPQTSVGLRMEAGDVPCVGRPSNVTRSAEVGMPR